MFRNYFKITYRNLLKNKVYSMVNILGLAVGMTACYFIFQYVHFESSYDRFNVNADRIYRVPISYSGSFGDIPTTAANHPAVGPALKAEFPEVSDFARIVPVFLFTGNSAISYTDKVGNKTTFNEEKVFLADGSFLSMFSFPFVSGDPKKALSEENTVVISQSVSEKYFGKENPLGQTIYFNGNNPLKVTGIFKDVPENSHIKFDMLISFLTLGEKWGNNEWTWPEFYTYVLLAPGTDPNKVEAKFPALIVAHLETVMKQLNFSCSFHLQPLTDIHLKSNYLKEPEANGSERGILLLSIIGIFILVIAWINYINLSTAKSIERAREVGLRKVVGATRTQLIGQFIFESIIINLLALVFATILVATITLFFDQFFGTSLSGRFLSVALWREVWFWFVLFTILTSGTLLVGAYPAFVLSAFKPALVIKGKFFQPLKGVSMRKVLVSFQFILSMILIAGTITVYMQLSFMRNQELGYGKDQILIVKAPAISDSSITQKAGYFKTELLKNASVTNVGSSSDIPGQTIVGRNSMWKASEGKVHSFVTFLVEADDNFINTLQMRLVAGRNFVLQDSSRMHGVEKSNVIVNEVVVNALGYKNNEEALHQHIILKLGQSEVPCEIIGVVQNYHQRSLREEYDPILFYYPDRSNWKYFSINVSTDNYPQNLAYIENLYKSTFSGNAFEYFFLDDYFNQQYQADQQFGNLFGIFTVLAIFIACLGLLGLSSFVIKLRTKEIGIRKVIGATAFSILYLFSEDFIKLIGFACVIAMPIIYITSKGWLDTYAFHIDLNWLIFVIPPVLLLIIALSTISIHTLKAAWSNPVKSLRTE